MSTARIYSAALAGIEAKPVVVEVDVASGLRAFTIVGLPDNAVKESKERLISALKNVGFKPPSQLPKRVTVNLAPGGLKKQGPSYDLPMALGFLLASGQLKGEGLKKTLVMGELSLEGLIRPVRGVLAATLMVRELGFKSVVVPFRNAPEAALVKGIDVLGIRSISEIIGHLRGDLSLVPFTGGIGANGSTEQMVDLEHISGQVMAKRALEIAATGRHHILFHGPPGAGKTLMAKALAGIMPPLSFEEALEVTRVYSAGGLEVKGLISKRPFRHPHHQTSPAAVLGGGTAIILPGEVTLAHHGVLFLDELPEFRRDVMEGLRQPLEEGVVHIARTHGKAVFPANFLLVAAMNPCPCGYAGDTKIQCRCPVREVEYYQRRVSGPILDRFDLHVFVPRLTKEELMSGARGAESSALVASRVTRARMRQASRFKGRYQTNSDIEARAIKEFCQLEPAALGLLERAIDAYALSARGYHKVLKVSRTIADLAGSELIKREHIGEALQYRLPPNFKG